MAKKWKNSCRLEQVSFLGLSTNNFTVGCADGICSQQPEIVHKEETCNVWSILPISLFYISIVQDRQFRSLPFTMLMLVTEYYTTTNFPILILTRKIGSLALKSKRRVTGCNRANQCVEVMPFEHIDRSLSLSLNILFDSYPCQPFLEWCGEGNNVVFCNDLVTKLSEKIKYFSPLMKLHICFVQNLSLKLMFESFECLNFLIAPQ